MTQEEKKNKNNKDYTKGKIYVIRNSENDLTYIGSTCQTLAQRMTQHRVDMGKFPHYKLYQAMNELGKDAFYIELLEDYPCQRKEELLKKEGEKIREHQSALNKVINGRSQKEYKEDNKEQIETYQRLYNQSRRDKIANHNKAYYKMNRYTILERNKQNYKMNKQTILETTKQNYGENKERWRQYYEKNKERIYERMRQYKENNKELIAERSRQYREKNKELIAERKRQYYQKNKDKLAERRRQLQNEKKQTATEWKDYAKLCG